MFRRGTLIEHYAYESRPYLLLAAGLGALGASGSHLMTVSSLLLIATCAYIVYLRYQYRVAHAHPARSGESRPEPRRAA